MEKIKDILRQIRPDVDFTQGNDFIKEGKLDSLDMIRLVADLDKKFNLSIDGADIVPENFVSLEAIAVLVRKNGWKGD